MVSVTLMKSTLCEAITVSSLIALKEDIQAQTGIPIDSFYLLYNGRLLSDENIPQTGNIELVPRVFGGKGGFGSMLRAIGAQIEKTTNREACRDLSGRRLRDINEEKRLKKWIDQQAERAKEAEEKKQKKLERLCEKPKYEFRDDEYDRLRSELPGSVEDSVTQGMKAAASTKRKLPAKEATITKKRPKLWLDADLEDLDSEDDSCSDDGEVSVKSLENVSSKDVNCEASCSSSNPSTQTNVLTESRLGYDEMSRPSTSTASVCGSDSRECPSSEDKDESSDKPEEECLEKPEEESTENVVENVEGEKKTVEI